LLKFVNNNIFIDE